MSPEPPNTLQHTFTDHSNITGLGRTFQLANDVIC